MCMRANYHFISLAQKISSHFISFLLHFPSKLLPWRTRGRQKIDMKKRENEEDRLITFSKRRAGLYKKASELCILCDADIGVVIFSPTGKQFSFAHPSIESIANQFLSRNPQPNESASQLFEAHRRARVNELNEKLNDQTARADGEKEREKMLEHIARGRGNRNWFDASILDGLNKEEVDRLIARFLEVQMMCYNRGNELAVGMGTSSSSSARAGYPVISGPSQGPSAAPPSYDYD
ncbi:agamous-like MADS-box protein AGL62 [Cornus florida]|uniref:agamous-like MADS-box protein AGL62 n=1 Tax=Cornus florida TaxID=4283 RepID=UPI0028988499|nr:agamous-like MADS-box protein AGL62 [Cornus florida]